MTNMKLSLVEGLIFAEADWGCSLLDGCVLESVPWSPKLSDEKEGQGWTCRKTGTAGILPFKGP